MSLKPIQVINKINQYYNEFPACGERSMHKLGQKVTEEVENTRRIIKKFLNANSEKEIIFTKNTTESINLVANSFDFKKVLITDREHNSNFLPWTKHNYEILPSNQDFIFNLDLFKEKVKEFDLISFVYTSNLDGYTLPVKEIIKIAHENNAKVLLDAAQAAPHKEINVKKLDVDFLAFSGHKMLGPTGTGVLYIKKELIEDLKPFILGGGTVYDATYSNYKLEGPPQRFEAGLQNYAGIIGLGEAAKYLMRIGLNEIEKHEIELTKLINKEGLQQIGYKSDTGIFSFTIPNLDVHEIATLLSESKNIMIRSGAHCMHSWFNKHGLKGSARISFYLYNTKEEVEILNEELEKIKKLT
jgi:cysteine desulfurase/selenocysteine lyase